MIVRYTSVRVRYADTDQMSFVYNGKYFEYFEVGRTELMRSLGFPYAELERLGYRLPLVEAHCNYFQPVYYDDLIEIESAVENRPGARLRIDYRIRRQGEDLILAAGHTIHAFTKCETGAVMRPPSIFTEVLERAPEREDIS
jgi:acyl-CoA thioester hydrolase